MTTQKPLGLTAHATVVACADAAAGELATCQLIADKLGIGRESVLQQPNVMWLQPERSYGRETVLQIVHELSMTTFDADAARCIVFTQADRLTPEAANALLKLIEEPPRAVYFFFLVKTVAQLLPTLRSRSQVRAILAPADSIETESAEAFLAASLPGRFGYVAELKERVEMLKLYQGLLQVATSAQRYALASWLLSYVNYAQGSGNLRLLLETTAMKVEALT